MERRKIVTKRAGNKGSPDWLIEKVNRLLVAEAEPGKQGYEDAIKMFPEGTQRLIREAMERKATPDIKQARRGSPVSDIYLLFPIIMHLIVSGLSAAEAWTLLQEEIPKRDGVDAKRQFNRARGDREKAVHQAASAVMEGRPNAFITTYNRLRKLTE
ncbi:MAG: hypothetical protein H7841_16530 [Magnetospirillum sp. WYHS-4]